MPQPGVAKFEHLPKFTFFIYFWFNVGYKDERIFVFVWPVA